MKKENFHKNKVQLFILIFHLNNINQFHNSKFDKLCLNQFKKFNNSLFKFNSLYKSSNRQYNKN